MKRLNYYDPIQLHVYTDSGRFYAVNGKHYPGVSTILAATDTTQQQEFWQQWRANPENVAYSEKAKNRGKLFHAIAENHFNQPNYRMDCLDADETATVLAEVKPFWESVQSILPRITNVRLIESAVWHEIGCYAGTVDMIASFDGEPCVLDWKTSAKPKQPEWCDRFPLQLAAYCACVNRMYGTRIGMGVIVVALPNAEAQVFRYELKEYWRPWLSKLVAYWEQQFTPLAEQALMAIQEEYGHNRRLVKAD